MSLFLSFCGTPGPLNAEVTDRDYVRPESARDAVLVRTLVISLSSAPSQAPRRETASTGMRSMRCSVSCRYLTSWRGWCSRRNAGTRAKRECAALQRAAPDGFRRGEPGHGGGVQASRDALAIRRARRETEAGGRSDAALSLRRARRMGRGVPSPHVVANLLGSLLERDGAPRAAIQRPPAGALVGRPAPWRRPPALLGRGGSLVRLRGVAASAPRRRQERAGRGVGVARRRVRS